MNYSISKIPKGNNKYREIYIPSGEYKLILKELIPMLNNILKENDHYGVNYAFEKGKNCVLNALQHLGYKYTLSMDIENFFDSVTRNHVKNIIPEKILSLCLINGNPKQGLPTSPIISTIAFLACDRKIQESFKKLNIDAVYTRYADDLIFSFNDIRFDAIIRFVVSKIVEQHDFKINDKKTNLQCINNGKVIITGLAIDAKGIYPTRKTNKKIRAARHQNNKKSLAGLVEWSKCKIPNKM